jgi:hypothetical protein
MQCDCDRTHNLIEDNPMTEEVKATFLKEPELSKRIGVAGGMLKNWRYKGRLMEGAHYIKVSQTCILYNLELMQHFVHWAHQPMAHQAAIARYLESLPYQQTCIDGTTEPHKGPVPASVE